MTIKLYSTPTCPYCKLVKDYLDEQGVAYEEADVAENSEAANEMVRISGQMGVPVIVAGDEVIVGWNKAELEKILGKLGSKVKTIKKEKAAV